MSHVATATTSQHTATPTGLIDEVMGLFQRGEDALFADLARATWSPHATLASLAGSLPAPADRTGRDAA